MSKYKITAPVTVTGPGWGLAFVNGVAETDNEALAKKLASKGYNVETEAPAAAFVCPVCGKISDSKFCPHCGAPMGG